MEVIIGFVLLGLVGYAIIKMTKKAEIEQEVVPEPVVAKVEEIKPAPVASLEPVVEKAKEEVNANINAKIEEAFVKAMVEEATKVETAVVEEVKVATKKVRAKAKAIEAAVEEKVEQLEVAVKKTKAKKAK
jgi:hypothetical protein